MYHIKATHVNEPQKAVNVRRNTRSATRKRQTMPFIGKPKLHPHLHIHTHIHSSLLYRLWPD